ncbi:hypothetical protein DPMN_042144 [Dreissena polymorpha]|uniref:Uncharacterized protein n=1 Tax=Dreissena polymorpha TaxID=45954 RepID=A0A9D4HWN7_DREPO|nr:hypothetical protein DPMN_042144 [Dreissena polymorpha]
MSKLVVDTRLKCRLHSTNYDQVIGIFNTNVKAVLLYGSETAGLPKPSPTRYRHLSTSGWAQRG